MLDSVIELNDVWFSFNGHPVLKGVNLKVRPRDFMALIGPNGGGKTTLLKLMLGLLKPDRGTIKVLGRAPSKVSHRIGYVPQNVDTNKSFPISVKDVVLMGRLWGGRIWRHYTRRDKICAREALEKMEMEKYRNRLIGELSGGQRQRVFIARALVTEPEILFFDEPTSSVDTQGQTELYSLLRKLNENSTILVVSHDFMVLSSYVKSVSCVNQCVHHHDTAEMTQEMLDSAYSCPVELVAHGIPHRVLQDH